MMRQVIYSIIYGFGTVIVILGVLSHQGGQDNSASTTTAASTTIDNESSNDNISIATSTANINGYIIQYIPQYIIETEPTANIRIIKNGQVVFQTKDESLWFSPSYIEGGTRLTTNPFKDASDVVKYGMARVLENGDPVLAFEGFAGSGSGCAYNENYVIELSNPLKILWQQMGCAGLVNIKNGAMKIQFGDSTFVFWNTDNVHSPQPEVILSLKGGQYKPDLSIMREPMPSIDDIKKQAAQWTAERWVNGSYESDICAAPCFHVPWGYALNLIYSGNAASAKVYLDLAWRPNSTFTSEKDFINQFTTQLKQSPYYNAILALNGGKIF